MSYQDRTLTCQDCGQSFTFSADDQAYHAEKGFTNEPKRCQSCRQSRRNERGNGGGYGQSPERCTPPSAPNVASRPKSPSSPARIAQFTVATASGSNPPVLRAVTRPETERGGPVPPSFGAAVWGKSSDSHTEPDETGYRLHKCRREGDHPWRASFTWGGSHSRPRMPNSGPCLSRRAKSTQRSSSPTVCPAAQRDSAVWRCRPMPGRGGRSAS